MPTPTDPLKIGKLDMELLAELIGDIPRDGSVVVGPGVGCDVAVIDGGGDKYLLLKSDPITFATDEIGHYAVTVNVNDIATAGGLPRWFLGTLLLPENATTPDLVRSIYDQLKAACAEYGVLLVGGHTEVTYGLDRPIFSGALVGEVAKDRLVTNRGAQVGDAILLTKGIAVEGTSIIAREKRELLLAAGFAADWLDRCGAMLHEPGIGVLAEAQAACKVAQVHTMHDPTEGGLAMGLWEMAIASDIGLRINRAVIPIFQVTRRLCAHFDLDPLGLIASGSLLLAVDPDETQGVIDACLEAGVSCTQIGRAVEAEEGCQIVDNGKEIELPRFDQDEIGKVFG